jgi:hypothetical protein
MGFFIWICVKHLIPLTTLNSYVTLILRNFQFRYWGSLLRIPGAPLFVFLVVMNFIKSLIKLSNLSINLIYVFLFFSSQTVQFVAMFEQRGMREYWA